MPRYTVTHRTAFWFKQTFDANELEVKPPFQRNPIWTDHQKSSLIDSMLRDYPIPELYLQEANLESHRTYFIIDGQQRITCFLEFLEGKFALTGEDSRQWGNMTFEDLPMAEKQKILDYVFVVRIFSDIPDEEVITIFQRLNRNVTALNQQELRHATYWGPFIRTMETLAEDEFWAKAGIFSTNEVRRTLDVEFVSELTIGHLHGMQNRKDSLDSWYQLYEEEFEQESEVKSVFNSVLGEISQLMPDISKTRWRSKADFYTLFLVVSGQVTHLPLSSDQRSSTGSTLVRFGQEVTEFLKNTEKNYSELVVQYGWAVVRSPSSLTNRQKRAEILSQLLASVW
jgi:Protein of unknown function DUF262